jgi:hypothetical protein
MMHDDYLCTATPVVVQFLLNASLGHTDDLWAAIDVAACW